MGGYGTRAMGSERRYCTGAYAQLILLYYYNIDHRAQPFAIALRCEPPRMAPRLSYAPD